MKTELLCASLLSLTVSACDQNQTARTTDLGPLTLDQQLDDFHWITGMFEQNYAPLQFKQARFGFQWNDLKRDYEKRFATQNMNHDEFAATIQEFVSKFKDGHTRATPIRAAMLDSGMVMYATLGFQTMREVKDGKNHARIFRVYDGFFRDSSAASVKEGDIVTSLDGRPVDTVVSEDITRYHDLGQDLSNATLGYSMLANRANVDFARFPTGEVVVGIRRGDTNFEVRLPWVKVDMYQLDQLQGVSGLAQRGRASEFHRQPDGTISYTINNRDAYSAKAYMFGGIDGLATRGTLAYQPEVARYAAAVAPAGRDYPSNTHIIEVDGFKFNLLPTEKGIAALHRIDDFGQSRLINCVESSVGDDGFTIKINVCRSPSGQDYANAFSKLADLGAKALILDLRSNGGGDLSYELDLAQAFAATTLEGNLAQLRLNEDWFTHFLLGSKYSPLPLRQAFAAGLDAIKADVEAGSRISRPLAIMGSAAILPVEKAWRKPIFILADEMCASACDVFTTWMQDNHLAKVIGTRTMGAGGNVISVGVSPHAQIGLSQTESMILRNSGEPIENEGADPDIPTEVTWGDAFWKTVREVVSASL